MSSNRSEPQHIAVIRVRRHYILWFGTAYRNRGERLAGSD